MGLSILTDEYRKMMHDFLRPKIVKSPPPPESCPGEIIAIVKGEKRARRPVGIWRIKKGGKIPNSIKNQAKSPKHNLG